MSIKLYVGNLSFQTSSDDLQELFSQAGTVESASVVEDRDTGRSRGFGFVEMATREEGEEAIARFNGREFNGRSLRISTERSENRRGMYGKQGRPRSTDRGGYSWDGLRRSEGEAVSPKTRSRTYIAQLFVNRTRILIQGITTNSLTPEACKEFNLESVDMHTSLSNFTEINLPIIRKDTYSLIYFLPGKVELTTPIVAETCLRLTDAGEGNTLADVFIYDEGVYKLQEHRFSLDGVMGCTAIANLGFCLLKSFHGITTRALSTITITARAWIDKYEQFDLKVADDPIFDFCKGRGVETVPLGAAKRDCDSWTECKDLPEGITCFHNIPKCK